MYENIIFFWQEWRHIIVLLLCIWFHADCKKKQRFLTTPTDYFVWGMLTIGLMLHFKGLPVG